MSETRYSRNQDVVKKMADLLRAGATMLSERCPICGLPLFRLKSGEVICPIHGRVYIVRTESEVTRVTVQGVLENLEKIAAEEIARLMEKRSEDLDTLREWLDVLERTERILSIMRGKEQEKPRKDEESGKTK
ncbi:Sjogren's syndrome/scleroderma autoantigen 1 family protein [Pyrofollis japonicus]|uniref:Sjogren's syndrome/scleroderma autoantigen 1 family protein n=1 Tax=Pyrofollis japonicus TaxID=3060460 RepID=UPI00295BC055|nr:Sjogren's syndrome/scleroderma autoantigen 1 family protein [Pyrofollis japonicus]BEP18098.1 Sjogren's syndrome/scleroderma autoantigen 1 family protein [Pyrofollis japonicus]